MHKLSESRGRVALPSSFGIACCRFRGGRYVPLTSSSRICSRKPPLRRLDGLERDPVDTREPRCSSWPSVGFASVSSLQTWTYRPQKRQDGSAFALA